MGVIIVEFLVQASLTIRGNVYFKTDEPGIAIRLLEGRVQSRLDLSTVRPVGPIVTVVAEPMTRLLKAGQAEALKGRDEKERKEAYLGARAQAKATAEASRRGDMGSLLSPDPPAPSRPAEVRYDPAAARKEVMEGRARAKATAEASRRGEIGALLSPDPTPPSHPAEVRYDPAAARKEVMEGRARARATAEASKRGEVGSLLSPDQTRAVSPPRGRRR